MLVLMVIACSLCLEERRDNLSLQSALKLGASIGENIPYEVLWIFIGPELIKASTDPAVEDDVAA
jgi:hypothetical protein